MRESVEEQICFPVPDTTQKSTDFSLHDNNPLKTTQVTEAGKPLATLDT